MSFTDAVRDGFSKYATFSGRSSRPAYWWWFLFGIIAVLVAYIIDAILGTGFVFYAIAVVALIVPNLAVTVRRLHDTGRSGWWILISLIPIAGGIVMLVFMLLASDGPNRWGNAPDTPAAGASSLA